MKDYGKITIEKKLAITHLLFCTYDPKLFQREQIQMARSISRTIFKLGEKIILKLYEITRV